MMGGLRGVDGGGVKRRGGLLQKLQETGKAHPPLLFTPPPLPPPPPPFLHLSWLLRFFRENSRRIAPFWTAVRLARISQDREYVTQTLQVFTEWPHQIQCEHHQIHSANVSSVRAGNVAYQNLFCRVCGSESPKTAEILEQKQICCKQYFLFFIEVIFNLELSQIEILFIITFK